MQYIDPADQGGTTTVTPPPGGPTPPPSASDAPTGPSAGQTPYTPPPPGPDQIQTSASYTPDYTSAIQNDPGYAAAQTAAQQAQANAAAARQAALRQQIIQYGGLPSDFKDAYGDVDQATLDAAAANQFSTMAGLKRNYESSVDQFRRALAARGALQSGDLNYGQDQLDTGYGQSQYDAANAFGNQVTGDINAYTGVLDQNRAALASAIQGAASNAYNDPANRPVAATTAQRDAALSSQYGQDIYKGEDGTLYTRDGSVYTPPSASAVPTYSPWNITGSGLYSHGMF